MNKAEILEAMNTERDHFYELLKPLSKEQICAPALAGGWSVKDVLAHLTAWEHRCAFWIIDGLCNKTPALPEEGYTWDEIDRLNHDTYLDYEDRSWESILNEAQAVHRHFYERLENIKEEDILSPDRFPWTEGKSLVPFIAAWTYDHFREHTAQVWEWASRQGDQ